MFFKKIFIDNGFHIYYFFATCYNRVMKKTIFKNKELEYIEITPDNIDTAENIQKCVWPQENVREEFLRHYHAKLSDTKDFIVYYDKQPVGLTGVYVERQIDSDTIWLSWFCVLPQHRHFGLGRKILKDTVEYAKNLKKFKYLRLNTTFWQGRPAIDFYNKNMQFSEKYEIEKTGNDNSYFMIYTTNLTKSKKFTPWGNKFLHVKNNDEEVYKNYIVN